MAVLKEIKLSPEEWATRWKQVAKWENLIYKAARKYSLDENWIENYVSTVRYNAVRRMGSYNPDKGKMGTWIGAVCHSVFLDTLKTRTKDGNVEEFSEDTTSGDLHGNVVQDEAMDRAFSLLTKEEEEICSRVLLNGERIINVCSELGMKRKDCERLLESGTNKLKLHYERLESEEKLERDGGKIIL